jgi:hypothetical protein
MNDPKDRENPESADLAAAKAVSESPETETDRFTPKYDPNNPFAGFMAMNKLFPPQPKEDLEGTRLMGLVPCMTLPETSPDTREVWRCGCGTENTGRFCTNCGEPNPEDTEYGHSSL